MLRRGKFVDHSEGGYTKGNAEKGTRKRKILREEVSRRPCVAFILPYKSTFRAIRISFCGVLENAVKK